MRTTVRAGIAIALIGTVLLLKNHLEYIRSQWPQSVEIATTAEGSYELKDGDLYFVSGSFVTPTASAQDSMIYTEWEATSTPIVGESTPSAAAAEAPAKESASPAEPASSEGPTLPEEQKLPEHPTASEEKAVPISLSQNASVAKLDQVIVVGKTRWENTDWVTEELSDSWQNAIYEVNNPEAPLRVKKNKGKESNVYLQYILDHYHALPSIIVFLHAHRANAWHIEFEQDNVRNMRRLKIDHVRKSGYVNLRCNWGPGCPDEVQPNREQHDERWTEIAFADAWKSMMNTTVPEVIAVPCCSQFAVTREQVLARPYSDYLGYHNWLMQTHLDDETSGRIFEYLWHIIFGQDPVQ
ncbi:hypothetical protein N7510_005069 [Penicillium lagena]|uniref:uncharacterized protein n=1 Tax=Penicillium lagena TaxID=94218 RepID=UPI0025426459|nr:uncharacterized protein N7510_005069 [Penicillium lagena]KAJ5621085.1 hypothetical protein N7510_005069 [Penicillium lagena]